MDPVNKIILCLFSTWDVSIRKYCLLKYPAHRIQQPIPKTTNPEFTNFVTMKKCFLTIKTINKNKGTILVDLVLISGKFGFVVSELVVGSGEQDDTVWCVSWLQLKNTKKIPPNILLTGSNNQIGNYESKIVRPFLGQVVQVLFIHSLLFLYQNQCK